ncbi:GNAT family N-acetyltransferase [Paractinoplanes ferrugineus]|uniref:N-acetyltransferase GCN5 n=1 Tax=Paractinoplanes ferrugineus TaxID=113564 RepID=A0A919MQ07_9ACTN|nr:GNAT family N-acetyltransferase [Actinoplanes ferrugineus]GIE15842.1 N-acetyltransferase GCN5 [Actinoplanes ferrugineus]
MSELRLRPVEDSDLDTLFEHQADPAAAAMADFPSRGREQFDAHWAKIRRDESTILRTVLVDDTVAGGVNSWLDDGRRLIGYWIGRELWGRGVASRALALFVAEVPERPLHAYVAAHNIGSMRVLAKNGFELVDDVWVLS